MLILSVNLPTFDGEAHSFSKRYQLTRVVFQATPDTTPVLPKCEKEKQAS
jgi:hypothetical protein